MPYQIKDTPYKFPFINELTIDQFVRLQAAKSDHESLEVLMGDLSELSKMDNAIIKMTAFIGLLDGLTAEIENFLKNPEKLPKGEKLTIMATEINLGPNLVKRLFWEKRHLRGLIKSMGKDPFNSYHLYKTLVGHYTYSIVSKMPFKEEKAAEYTEEVIADLSFKDVIRIGDYILFAERDLWNSKKDSLALAFGVKEAWIKARFNLYNPN